MPRPPRLVATDVDGTLLRSDGLLSPRTRAVLADVRRAGVGVVLATGRPPRWMDMVIDLVPGDGLAVCSNGALLVDLHRERVLRSRLLEPDRLAAVVAAVRKVMPEAAFAVEYGWTFAAQAAYLPVEEECRIVELDEIIARPAAKLLAKHPTLSADEVLALLAPAVGELATCTHSSLASGLVEMSAPGVTKATMLADLCADLGIDAADVVAFGDMPNDLEMLGWAGRSYAVANAHADVLAAVPDRAESNDADGVALTLARLFALAPTG